MCYARKAPPHQAESETGESFSTLFSATRRPSLSTAKSAHAQVGSRAGPRPGLETLKPGEPTPREPWVAPPPGGDLSCKVRRGRPWPAHRKGSLAGPCPATCCKPHGQPGQEAGRGTRRGGNQCSPRLTGRGRRLHFPQVSASQEEQNLYMKTGVQEANVPSIFLGSYKGMFS